MGKAAKLRSGKLPVQLLRRLVRFSGLKRKEVVLGPAIGEDAAAVGVADRYLVIATDPVTFTTPRPGWYAVFINANDVAVSGARPLYFQSCIVLPEGSPEELPLAIAKDIHQAARTLRVSVTGGHTEVSEAVHQPVVAGTMIGLTKRLIYSGGARPGDLLIQIGFAGIEGSAILASRAGSRLLRTIRQNEKLWLKRNLDLPAISVVEPALAASDCGARALHDATEGGIAAAIHEMGMASHCRFAIDLDQVMIREATVILCKHYRINPFALLSSGSMLAAMSEANASKFLCVARRHRWPAAVIGQVRKGKGIQATLEGKPASFPYQPRDPLAELPKTGARPHPRQSRSK